MRITAALFTALVASIAVAQPPKTDPPIIIPASVSTPERLPAEFDKLPPLKRQMYLAGQRGSEWLFRAHQSNGRFLPGWLPAFHRACDASNDICQAAAAETLARSAAWLKDERLTVRARQAMLTLLAETSIDPSDANSRMTTLPSTALNRVGMAGSLASAIYQLPNPGNELLEQADQLTRFVARQQSPDGSLRLTDIAVIPADAATVRANAGIGLRAIARSATVRPAPWKTAAMSRSVTAYRIAFKNDPHPEFAATLAAAFADAALVDRNLESAAFAFELCDNLLNYQYDRPDPRNPMWFGGFQTFSNGKPAGGMPTIDSAMKLEAIAAGCRLARQIPDQERFSRYRAALERGLQFVSTLQFTEANSQQFTAACRPSVLGGFAASPQEGTIWLHGQAHTVAAIIDYVTLTGIE